MDEGANAGDESIDGVDVVWIAREPERGGRRVVGWYRNATVYHHRQEFENYPSPQHSKDEIDTYRIRARSEDATLLPLEDRSDPRFRLGTGKGWIGHTNWWFPEQQSDPAIKEFVRGLREFIDARGEYVPKPSVKSKWGGGSDIERKAKVEQAAIGEVKKHYHEYIVTSVEEENVGWDLEAKSRNGGEAFCLEVKGLFGSELKVGLTPNEYRALVRHKEGEKSYYRLCVVTEALSDKPVLRIFRYEMSDNKWFDAHPSPHFSP
jgi:hypothetical protein